jgi:hypothetical protein
VKIYCEKARDALCMLNNIKYDDFLCDLCIAYHKCVYICTVFFMVLDFKVNNEDWLSVRMAIFVV